ncbi:ribonuclease D [soil metagenome]
MTIEITRREATARNPQVIYVNTSEQLAEVCAKMAPSRRLAIDTEFVGEKYYYPRLELLQLADEHIIALIDAPAIADLSPLAELLGDPKRLKILHAAGQDLEIMKRALGRDPLPIFDTQVAASMLGQGAQISLAGLIKGVLGVDVSGKQTTSDWTHRPLSQDQLEYAAEDVRHLLDLHDVLSSELKLHGRNSWYEDEQESRVRTALSEDARPDREFYSRVKDWMSLRGKELAVLRELAEWRELTARSRNQPRKTILTEEGLIELARFQPLTKEAAQKLRRVNVGQIVKNFPELKRCIETGRALPKDQWPVKTTGERPDIPTGLLELCQALLRSVAEASQIAPTVLATTSDLQQLITRRADLDSLDNPLLTGWRRDLAGQKIVDLLRGRIQVTVNEDGGLLFGDVERTPKPGSESSG